MPMNPILFILEIVSFTALILSSIFLAVAYIPHEKKVPNVRRSKNLVQLACILLGSSGVFLSTQEYQLTDLTFYVQIMAQTESALLIMSMILLLTRKFNARRFLLHQFLWIGSSTILLYLYYNVMHGTTESPMYYLLASIFLVQFLYYFFTYKHLFEEWRNKKYQYTKYGSTIKFLWLLLNLMALFVMTVLYFPGEGTFSALVSFYTIDAVIFTILFYKLLIILNTADFEGVKQQTENKGREKGNRQTKLETAINEWIENKGYLERNVTIKMLAKQLGTNRTYLSNYINERFDGNFNAWLNQQRIQEALLLLEDDQHSLHEVADLVGFTDLPHFSRTFKSITGQSPSTWRKQTATKEKNAD